MASDSKPPAEQPRRPQLPRRPAPYRELDVGFDNRVQHSRLAGTLTLPEGTGPFPAALLITGSGLHDRDETIAGHKPFLVLADHLTRRGIAVLRVDDRTVGGSTGEVAHATSADFATDVEAGVSFLRGHPEIDPRRIGLIGHSEGGMIGPMVAARDPDVAFVVMMAGPAVPLRQIVIDQQRLILLAAGVPAADVDRAAERQAAMLDAVLGAADEQAARDAATAGLEALGAPAEQIAAAAEVIAGDWYRYLLGYDPRPALAALRMPVLAINGALDLQTPAGSNLEAMRSALSDNPDATVIELPGLNHLFQTCRTGSPDEYEEIEETVAPLALETIGDWLVARFVR